MAGGGARIPRDRNYKRQLKVYENQTRETGLYRMHGLRHYSGRRIIPKWHATLGKNGTISAASITGSD